jgi:hypothetical protein
MPLDAPPPVHGPLGPVAGAVGGGLAGLRAHTRAAPRCPRARGCPVGAPLPARTAGDRAPVDAGRPAAAHRRGLRQRPDRRVVDRGHRRRLDRPRPRGRATARRHRRRALEELVYRREAGRLLPDRPPGRRRDDSVQPRDRRGRPEQCGGKRRPSDCRRLGCRRVGGRAIHHRFPGEAAGAPPARGFRSAAGRPGAPPDGAAPGDHWLLRHGQPLRGLAQGRRESGRRAHVADARHGLCLHAAPAAAIYEGPPPVRQSIRANLRTSGRGGGWAGPGGN